ncbi:MAG: hypothetical protein KDK41_02365 [Leptospiraceae bacterium]|nr:hypothetical protein [Leptospiraceae bacterium]MCB1199462.1 hypothetical protein [Leptospiraceae bacterium]
MNLKNYTRRIVVLVSLVLVYTMGNLTAQIPTEAANSDRIAEEGENKVREAIKAVEKAEMDAKKKAENAGSTTTVNPAATTETTTAGSEGAANNPGAIIYNDGRMNYANSQTKFELTASDQISDVDYIEYRINDAPLQRYIAPFPIEQEGLHRIVYRGVDRAGNREAEQVYPVTIDNTPPTVSTSTNKALVERFSKVYAGPDTALELRAVDALSGVKKIDYSVNNGGFQTYGGPIALTANGEQVIKFKATDNLNNESSEKTFVVEIDATSPVVAITPSQRMILFDGKRYALRNTVFTVTATDNQSGIDRIMIKVDGEAEFRNYSQPINLPVEGEHVIEAKAIDRAGNESQIVKIDFITDDNPPRTTIRPVTDASASAPASTTTP